MPGNDKNQVGIEDALLGGILTDSDGEFISQNRTRLVPDLFLDQDNRRICRAVLAATGGGKKPDVVFVKRALEANGGLKPGDAALLSRLMDCGLPVHLAYYLSELEEADRRRKMITAYRNGAADLQSGKDPAQVRGETEGKLAAITGRETAAGVHTAAELLAMADLSEPEHVIEKLLPPEGGLLICGDGGAGKSLMALELAVRLATGTDFCGLRINRPHKVAYFSMENSLHLTGYRLRQMAGAIGIEAGRLVDNLVTVHDISLNLRNLKDRAALAQRCEAIGAGVNLFDPAISFFGRDGDENKSTDVRFILDLFTAINRKTGSAAIVCHHVNKDRLGGLRGRVRGSTDFLNWADCAVLMEKQQRESRRNTLLKLHFLKTRSLKEPDPLTIERNDTSFIHTMKAEAGLCSITDLKRTLEDEFGGEAASEAEFVEAVARRTGASKKTVRRRLIDAEDDGFIRRDPDPNDRRVRRVLLLSTNSPGTGDSGQVVTEPF